MFKLNRRGFSVVQVGSVLLCMLIIGIALPILDPFLQLGIAATGGITSYLLMAIPLFLVAGGIMYLFRTEPPRTAGW